MVFPSTFIIVSRQYVTHIVYLWTYGSSFVHDMLVPVDSAVPYAEYQAGSLKKDVGALDFAEFAISPQCSCGHPNRPIDFFGRDADDLPPAMINKAIENGDS